MSRQAPPLSPTCRPGQAQVFGASGWQLTLLLGSGLGPTAAELRALGACAPGDGRGWAETSVVRTSWGGGWEHSSAPVGPSPASAPPWPPGPPGDPTPPAAGAWLWQPEVCGSAGGPCGEGRGCGPELCQLAASAPRAQRGGRHWPCVRMSGLSSRLRVELLGCNPSRPWCHRWAAAGSG